MKAKDFFKIINDLKINKTPGQVVIQYLDHCNALCPQCGMNKTNTFKRTKLSYETIRKTLRAAAELDAQAISFTGGEPLLFLEELTDHLRYAGELGFKYLRTGTNAYFLAHDHKGKNFVNVKRVADALASTPLRNLWISIDSSVPWIHEKMRGFPGLMENIPQGLEIFHKRGLYPAANLGINRNLGGYLTSRSIPQDFNHQTDYLDAFYQAIRKSLENFFDLVINMGFTMVNLCYPMNVENQDQNLKAVYQATGQKIVQFTNSEKAQIFKALMDVIPFYRRKIRLFSPRSSLYALFRHYSNQSPISYPCRGGLDYFFVDSGNGLAYPCGFRGAEPLGHLWEIKQDQLNRKHKCRLCDWECFRDPSQLFGPISDFRQNPLKLLTHFKKEPFAAKLWMEDIRYYQKCGFFNGRKNFEPNIQKSETA